MKQFDIITIFPKIFESYIGESILKRAQEKKLIKIATHDLRKFSTAKSKIHRSVDDRPYGGGPGMILMIEPLVKALRSVKRKKKSRVILLTPAGKRFTQREAERLVKYDQLIMLCGRYEGFDARIEKYIDEEISIGDYVLAGGELAAMVVTEAVARHVPGVIGHADALRDETFSPPYAKVSGGRHGLDYVEASQYSRPEKFDGQKVPSVLLSGDHKKIKAWREKQAKRKIK